MPSVQDIALPLTAEGDNPKYTMPWKTMIPLFSYRIAHSAAFSVVFPFITDMITSFNVPTDRIGLYAGMGEGVLMLTEAAVAPLWARLSDRYGRRPIMVWTFLFCAFPAAMMGFSTKPWHVLVLRGLFGILSCDGTARTILAEVATPQNRVPLFALYGPTWHVGAMIGTMIGGELAHPYGRLPVWLGGKLDVSKHWPYALPCLVVGAMGACASFIGILFLDESRVKHEPLAFDADEEALVSKRGSNLYVQTLKVPNFLVYTVIYCTIQLMIVAYEGIYSVYTYTPVPSGGLGLPVDIIGLVMAGASLVYISMTPTLLPWLISRIGTIPTLYRVLLIWPFLGACLAVSHWIAGTSQGILWPTVGVLQILKSVGIFAWAICEMLTLSLFDHAPHLLATGSAISILAAAIGRAIGPTLAGWVFSLSTQYDSGSLGRQSYWILYLVLTLPPLYLVRRLTWQNREKEKPRKDGYNPAGERTRLLTE